jgi:hypothetical protein
MLPLVEERLPHVLIHKQDNFKIQNLRAENFRAADLKMTDFGARGIKIADLPGSEVKHGHADGDDIEIALSRTTKAVDSREYGADETPILRKTYDRVFESNQSTYTSTLSCDNTDPRTNIEHHRNDFPSLQSEIKHFPGNSTTSDDSDDVEFLEGTDFSEDSPETPLTSMNARFSPTLRDFGLEVISLLNIELRVLFEGRANFATHTEPSGCSNSGSEATQQNRSTASNPSQKSNEKRKRDDDQSGSADDGQDDYPNKPSSALRRISIIRPLRSKLACPFYKNNPAKYEDWRSCPGPGWDSVHRIKYVVIVFGRSQILRARTIEL